MSAENSAEIKKLRGISIISSKPKSKKEVYDGIDKVFERGEDEIQR